MGTRQWSSLGRYVLILLIGLAVGLLLGLGWQWSTPADVAIDNRQSGQVQLAIQQLETDQEQLKARLAELRQEVAEHQQTAAAQTDRLQVLKVELDRQQLLAGLMPVQGPGVQVELDDSAVQIPANADPNAYIIHEYDLRDIVNLLWAAGSEAISVNGERLVSQSSIYCVGSTVMVNNTRLSPPYLIQAIGNPRVQQDHLRNPSYLQNLREKERMYGLRFEVRASTQLSLPAYSGGFLVQYARPGD